MRPLFQRYQGKNTHSQSPSQDGLIVLQDCTELPYYPSQTTRHLTQTDAFAEWPGTLARFELLMCNLLGTDVQWMFGCCFARQSRRLHWWGDEYSVMSPGCWPTAEFEHLHWQQSDCPPKCLCCDSVAFLLQSWLGRKFFFLSCAWDAIVCFSDLGKV